jgi:hypothetical protein
MAAFLLTFSRYSEAGIFYTLHKVLLRQKLNETTLHRNMAALLHNVLKVQ